MKKVNLFEQFLNEKNLKKEAQTIANQIIGQIEDMINNDEEVEEPYYLLKDYFNSFDLDRDSKLFDLTLDIISKWSKKQKYEAQHPVNHLHQQPLNQINNYNQGLGSNPASQ